jgi:hypothetical protein
MSRSKTAYGFRTVPADPFIARVAAEAKPADRFLVASAKETITGASRVIVLVRNKALVPKSAGLTLLGKPLSITKWGKTIPQLGFKFAEVETPDPEKTLGIVKTEIRAVKNWLAGRTLRVVVESV